MLDEINLAGFDAAGVTRREINEETRANVARVAQRLYTCAFVKPTLFNDFVVEYSY